MAFSDHSRDCLLIYFAGHGQVLGHSGYLATADAQQFDPGISLTLLADLTESASKVYRHVVVILDCCHSGAAFTSVNARPLGAQDIDRELISVNESRCILAACRPEQTAKENGSPVNGVFTAALVDGLMGNAVDYDGNISLFSLYDYVARTVPNNLQTPVFKGDIAGTVLLGSGFTPRQGPPIATSDLSKTLSKATALVDQYYNIEYREWFSDRSHRLHSGALTCAKELEGTVRWFRSTQHRLPDIAREQQWGELSERIEGFRRTTASIEVGQQLSMGTVTGLLGHGGFGHVWKVRGADGHRALKVFQGDKLDDDIMVQRFENGYNTMKKLSHPRIVRVHDITLAPYAFSMDYIEGDNLKKAYLDRDEPEKLIRLLLDISETVQYAHSNGIKHRDIKPENIIVKLGEDLTPVPYLTDFDLAYHETNRTLTSALGVGGVINYAAPEQMYAPNAAAARANTVDIFAMGQLLFYIVTGKTPSAHDFDLNHRTLRKMVNSWVDDGAAKCLFDLYVHSTQRAPKDRPQSMADFSGYLSRTEAHVIAASGRDEIPEENFCRRIAHLYAGVNNYEASDRQARCRTLSGQLELMIRIAGIHSKGNIDMATVELEFTTINRLTIPSFSSGASGRSAINGRLDRALAPFPKAKRTSGHKGTYQVFVKIANVALTGQSAAEVCEILKTSIAAIEVW
ncbi:hypothetical protein GCM10010174_89960 [Kutzneria viridogrisea]